MRVLLDESVPAKLRTAIAGHEVFTVSYMGWKGTKNGALVARAVADGFDVIVTTDRGIADQVNLTGQPISIAILYGTTNRLAALMPLVPALLKELNHITPGKFVPILP